MNNVSSNTFSFLIILLLMASFVSVDKFLDYRTSHPRIYTESVPGIDFQKSTSDWKIYNNKINKMSLKFPQNYDFIDVPESSTVLFIESLDEKEKLQECLKQLPVHNCTSSVRMVFRKYAKPENVAIDNVVRDGLSVELENGFYRSLQVGGNHSINKQQKISSDPDILFIDLGGRNILEVQSTLKDDDKTRDVYQKMVGTMDFPLVP